MPTTPENKRSEEFANYVANKNKPQTKPLSTEQYKNLIIALNTTESSLTSAERAQLINLFALND